MKKFQFRLQPLLNYRRHLEQLAKQEMAKVVADIAACEQRIQGLLDDGREAAQKLDRLVEKGMEAGSFNSYRNFITSVEYTVSQERALKAGLEKTLEEKREALKKRTIEKKALERLREKQADAYTQEMIREEQKGLDEMASVRKAREVNNEHV